MKDDRMIQTAPGERDSDAALEGAPLRGNGAFGQTDEESVKCIKGRHAAEDGQAVIQEELSEQARMAYDGDYADPEVPRRAEPAGTGGPEQETVFNGWMPVPAAGAGDTAGKKRTRIYPDVFTMTSYLCCNYKLDMYSYMNSCLRDGTLQKTVGFPFRDTWLTGNSCRLEQFKYWRIDRTNFFADVSVLLKLRAGNGQRPWRGTLVMWCSFAEEDEENPFQQLRDPDLRRNGCAFRRGKGSTEDADFMCNFVELIPGTPDRSGYVWLSPFLVPYYKGIDVDRISEEMWIRYMPEALRDPAKRDATELAKRMGLSVEYYPVRRHNTVESILFFRADTLEIHDEGAGEGAVFSRPAFIEIHGGTIVINTNKLRRDYSSHSIFHECFHYEEHYLFYRLQGLRTNDATKIKVVEVTEEPEKNPEKSGGHGDPAEHLQKASSTASRSGSSNHVQREEADAITETSGTAEKRYPGKKGSGGEKEKKNKENRSDPIFFMEWQANRGALGLAMPAGHTRELIFREIDCAMKDMADRGGQFRHHGELMEDVGWSLYKILSVPCFRIQARMVQLGFYEAKGALNFVDRRHIEPFAFSPDALSEPMHTFVISQKAVDDLILGNEEFREIMHSGNFVFADGHVVRNRPQFVTIKSDLRDGDRKVLTGYAGARVDECCLRFVKVVVQEGVGRYTYGRMYYDADFVTWNKFYLDDFINRENLGDIDEIEARIQFKKRFPETFREAFNYLRVARGYSMVKMAREMGMDDQTLRRWLDDPARYRNEDFLTIVSITLKLPDWISGLLFQRASMMLFEDNPRHLALMHVLRVYGTDDIKKANEYLEKHKFSRLRV